MSLSMDGGAAGRLLHRDNAFAARNAKPLEDVR